MKNELFPTIKLFIYVSQFRTQKQIKLENGKAKLSLRGKAISVHVSKSH